MLDKREARIRVLEYAIDFLSTSDHDGFIVDCSETEEDAKLLKRELDIFERELQEQLLEVESQPR